MKRLLMVSIAVCILIFLCACGKKSSDEVPESMIAKISEAVDSASNAEGQGATTVMTEGTDSNTAITADPNATAVTPVPEISTTPVPTAVPTATPAPTTRVYNYVTITKDPTGETVQEGGSATFIARANNATSTNWIMVSPDANTSFRAEEAPSHFSGVSVSGQGTDSLTVSNIPFSMDGWRIQCYFTGNGGPEYTMGAYITVASSQEEVDEAKSLADACTNAVGEKAEEVAPGIWKNNGRSSYSFSNGIGKFVVTLTCGDNRIEVICRCFTDNYAYYPVEVIWSTVSSSGVKENRDLILTESTTYDKAADDAETGNWQQLKDEIQTITGKITLS